MQVFAKPQFVLHPCSKRFEDVVHAKMHSPVLLIILSTDPLSIALCGSDALVKRTLPSGEEACNENTLAEGEGQSEKLASIALSDFHCHFLPPTPPHPKYPAPVAPLVPDICSAQA